MITGPTASGKTAAALELALKLGCPIISADARQCYQGMAIGSAQPAAEEQAVVKHYFVNCFPVQEIQSAATFEHLALGYLTTIFTQHHFAILCGGSGLYIRALCEGLDDMPPVVPSIAASVQTDYQEYGLEWLQRSIQQEDPSFRDAEALLNPARMIRALSFVRSTGKSILLYRSGQTKSRPFRILKFALDLPRKELYTRINQRVEHMMAAGLEEEAHSLLPYRHLPPLQTVGYTELFDYFDGLCTLDKAIEKIAQHTRNYAKRQGTWFRRDASITWLDANQYSSKRILEAL
ncbi:MAG: tRNA (adenosine(37)-N6)-dimethylallyltransferase MiaA [Bacteroidetes bacterium]|nr:tRNA (adenosine(37)-N6)-dimethylallyltransferase MiaA [Bacteroidota bacterium]